MARLNGHDGSETWRSTGGGGWMNNGFTDTNVRDSACALAVDWRGDVIIAGNTEGALFSSTCVWCKTFEVKSRRLCAVLFVVGGKESTRERGLVLNRIDQCEEPCCTRWCTRVMRRFPAVAAMTVVQCVPSFLRCRCRVGKDSSTNTSRGYLTQPITPHRPRTNRLGWHIPRHIVIISLSVSRLS